MPGRIIPRLPGRPLGVGVQLPEVEREVRWPELRAIARTAEDAGFDSVWFGDHLLYRYAIGRARGPWEAWTTLAGLAEATERIAMGPLVAATAFHVPFMLAKLASTVDEISGGRLVLGIGAGWNDVEFARARRAVRPPDQPLRGGVHDRPDAARGGRDRLRGRVLHGARGRAAAAVGAGRRPAAAHRVERTPDARRDDALRGRMERVVRGHPQLARGRRAAADAGGRRGPGRRSRPGRDRADGRRPGPAAGRHRAR